MRFADLLFNRPPKLPSGQTRTFKDNWGKKPNVAGDEAVKQGERQRGRILSLIDEIGDVTLPIVSDELEVSVNCARRHLSKLVSSGELIEHTPKRRGIGQNISWTRRLA